MDEQVPIVAALHHDLRVDLPEVELCLEGGRTDGHGHVELSRLVVGEHRLETRDGALEHSHAGVGQH